MFLKTFLNLLSNIDHDIPNFQPTILYNEGWLLRLLVDWFSKSEVTDHPLSFPKDGHWFSEARLPSAFLPRFKGDPLTESHTHADGVIGHFTIGRSGKTNLELKTDATHFVELEAKLNSGLSKGVTNAKYYNQATTNVACIAEVLRRATSNPNSISRLGFCVLAPKVQIKIRTFTRHLDKHSILDKVERRVSSYKGERDDWYKDWFTPTLEIIEICSISWESVLNIIRESDPKTGRSLTDYFSQCLTFNS